MFARKQDLKIHTKLANKYHLPKHVIEVICNHPFKFANQIISDPENRKNIMFAYLFKIKPKKIWINETSSSDSSDSK